MKKLRFWITFFAVAVALTAAMIFLFSAQDGPTSSKTSGWLVNRLIGWFHPEYDSLPQVGKNRLFSSYQHLVRKGAHFSEFALLGAFLLLLLNALKRRWKAPLSWLLGTLYACTDELHQMAVSSRAAMWQDVLIDSAGVLFGVLVALLILTLRKRKPPAEESRL